MYPRYGLLVLGLALAHWHAPAGAQEDKDKAKEVEVLARGPVHEAYAEPTEREPAPTPIVNKEPPKPIEELPPDQKPEGDNVQWLPGYWSYDEDRKDYVWVSGFWRVSPPGRTWVAGSWRQAGAGWQWSGGFWAAAKEQKAQVEYLPQPPAPLDNDGANTPAPTEDHIYVPGSWIYRDRYVWRPGFWMEHRDGWVWTSAHYRWTPGGYVYIDGYWDYPLATRGTLFAPVYIPPVVYSAPDYVYTPTVYVRESCLFGAFFARRGYGSYYFGDYFAPHYASIGFVGWGGHVSASVTLGGYYDPLFSYYRCGYRRDPFWGGGGIGNLYAGRYRGDYARPPHTLVQQNTVINNITNNNTTIINKNKTINNNVVQQGNLNNVTMLSSIRDGNRDGRRFTQVSDTARREQQTAARDLREVGTRRADAETRLASGGPKGGLNTGPRSVQLDVPPSRTIQTPPAKGGLGNAGGNITPKGGLGSNNNPPKGGLGSNNNPPKGGLGNGTTPKGIDIPQPPKATAVGGPKGGPKGGITIPPKGMLNPPATGGNTLPPPRTVNDPPRIGGNNPVTPKTPPATIGNPAPKGANPPTPMPPSSLPKTVNPPTLPPSPKIPTPPANVTPKTISPPVTPRTVTPPPTATPKTVAPPATTAPKTATPPTPKATPKTKANYTPSPIASNPVPLSQPRSVTSQPRPLTSQPAVTAPKIAPRPTITSPPRPAAVTPRPATVAPRSVAPRPVPVAPRAAAPRAVAPRPAMVNPRPANVAPRIAPSAPRVSPAPRPSAPRPSALPGGASKRPIRR